MSSQQTTHNCQIAATLASIVTLNVRIAPTDALLVPLALVKELGSALPLDAPAVVDRLAVFEAGRDDVALFCFAMMAAEVTAPVVPSAFWYGAFCPSISAAETVFQPFSTIK